MTDLSAATLQRLKALLVDDNFKAYLEVLDAESKIHTEKLLATDARTEFYKGFVLGLKRAKAIAKELVDRDESTDARASKSRDAEQRKAEQRKRATYGSGWFKSAG